MYLNLIIGLTYKWYDQEKIDDFLISWEEDRELYEVFFGSDLRMHCTKRRKIRSVMEELRREYALDNLNRYRNYKEYARIEQIRNAHCREILGQPSELTTEEEGTSACISYTEEMTTDEILEQTRENLWKYFSYRPSKAAKKKKNIRHP